MSKQAYLLLDEYITDLSRNKSAHTIRNYYAHVNRFLEWVIENDHLSDDFNMSKSVYLDYIDNLKSCYAAKSVHSHMTAIYNFLGFLGSKRILNELPFFTTKEMNSYLPVIQKKKVKSLNRQTIIDVIQGCSDSLLTECIVRTFYDTGMRVSELVRAKWSDIEQVEDKFILQVYGKGRGGMSKMRIVKITPKTIEKLNELKNLTGVQSEYIFVSERTKKPFTERRIDQVVRLAGKEAGIDPLNTHVFRKSIATHLIEKGMNVEYVSKYLGHSDISTTINNYVDLDNSLMEKIDEFHVSL